MVQSADGKRGAGRSGAAWIAVLAFTIAAEIAGFIAGGSISHRLSAPGGSFSSGEDVMSAALTALFIGGPIGAIIGIALGSWLAWRVSPGMGAGAAIVALVILGVVGVYTARLTGVL